MAADGRRRPFRRPGGKQPPGRCFLFPMKMRSDLAEGLTDFRLRVNFRMKRPSDPEGMPRWRSGLHRK